ncbi:MAG: hypothetical protein IKX05_06860 [Bacteroidales bacterium]|nr:hypothetical protein [Bacteroidales bacterium]
MDKFFYLLLPFLGGRCAQDNIRGEHGTVTVGGKVGPVSESPFVYKP